VTPRQFRAVERRIDRDPKNEYRLVDGRSYPFGSLGDRRTVTVGCTLESISPLVFPAVRRIDRDKVIGQRTVSGLTATTVRITLEGVGPMVQHRWRR
jgi:hypothetical protein